MGSRPISGTSLEVKTSTPSNVTFKVDGIRDSKSSNEQKHHQQTCAEAVFQIEGQPRVCNQHTHWQPPGNQSWAGGRKIVVPNGVESEEKQYNFFKTSLYPS